MLPPERPGRLAGQRQFGANGNPKRKRGNKLREIPRLRVGLPKTVTFDESGAVQLGSRLTDALDSEANEPVMMLQLWVTSPSQLDTSTTAQITRDFALLRQTISEQITTGATR